MTRQLIRFAGFLVMTLFLIQAAHGEEKASLLVMDLQPSGVEPEIAKSLSGLLAMEVERLDRFEIISQREIAGLLSAEEHKQLMGVEENDEKIGEIGEKLKADYLLVGQLGKVGSTYVLSLSLLNVKTLKAERRVKQTLVGMRDELIGSLRSAAIALALEEKGVAPDITETLIRDLHISEKEKTMFFHLRAGYEVPVGPVVDDATIPYFLPNLFHIDVDAAYHALPWLQVGLSTGFAFSVLEKHKAMTKYLTNFIEDSPGGTPGGTEYYLGEKGQVYATDIDFSAYRIPMDFYVRFQPSRGLFLPYALVGLGISYNSYSFDNEHLQINKLDRTNVDQATDTCPAAYSNKKSGYCYPNIPSNYKPSSPPGWYKMDNQLKPDSNTVDFFGLDVIAGAGFDYLFHENLGFSVEMKYIMVYAFKSEDDLGVNFIDGPFSYNTKQDGTGDKGLTMIGDTHPIRQIHHGLMLNIGLTMYF